MLRQVCIPFAAIVVSCIGTLGIWHIAVYKIECFEFQSNDPALTIEILCADPVRYRNGFFPGQNQRAGVALPAGAKGPVSIISLHFHHRDRLDGLSLLKRIDIGICLRQECRKTMIPCSSNSIHVPGDHFHCGNHTFIRFTQLTDNAKKSAPTPIHQSVPL